MTVPVYVINLDRRPERMAKMQEQLDRMKGVDWRRIVAIDAKSVSRKGPYLDAGSVACQMSHMKAMKAFLDTPPHHDYAVILEDDVELSPAFPEYLKSTEWIPDDVGLIKLDNAGIWGLGKFCGCTPDGRVLQRMEGFGYCLGGYMLSREVMRLVLDAPEHRFFAIDDVIFNQILSLTATKLNPAVLIPALVQFGRLSSDSDIEPTRRERKDSTFKLRYARKLVRWRFRLRKVNRMRLLRRARNKSPSECLDVPFF